MSAVFFLPFCTCRWASRRKDWEVRSARGKNWEVGMDIDNVNKVLLERAIKEHSAQVGLRLTAGRDSGACLTQDGGDQKSKLAKQGSGDKWQVRFFRCCAM